ncbi:MAG: phosphoenolpyruvate carboxykinase (ATP), partial [Fidelibacterota bacterium]
PPMRYARLLKEKMEAHGTKVYLVNTGWSGGSAASGAKRMPLDATRAMVTAILTGEIEQSDFTEEPVFGLEIPASIHGVDRSLLMPRQAWSDKDAYDRTARLIAHKFRDNFVQYSGEESTLEAAGPRV